MARPRLIRMLTELRQNRMLSAEEGSVMYRMAPYVRQLQTHEQQKLQLVLCTCLYQYDLSFCRLQRCKWPGKEKGPIS